MDLGKLLHNEETLYVDESGAITTESGRTPDDPTTKPSILRRMKNIHIEDFMPSIGIITKYLRNEDSSWNFVMYQYCAHISLGYFLGHYLR